MYGKTSPPPLSPSPSLSSNGSSGYNQSPPFYPSSFGSRPQSPARHSATASAKRHKFLRRLVKFRQMDFEYAFWQMLYLFVSPQKVYRNFQYRKYTKDQYSRDDPAFLVLLAFWYFVSSIGFGFVLGLTFFTFLKFLIWVILIDCLAVGLLVASCFWLISNKYLIASHLTSQDIEWGYAFDVHLNAFFPLLMILHFFQLPFLHHVINANWFIGYFFGNTLWLIAVCYYVYITFLGYSALPYVKKPQILLYPMTGMFIIYVLSLMFGWNFSLGLCNFYKYRVVTAV